MTECPSAHFTIHEVAGMKVKVLRLEVDTTVKIHTFRMLFDPEKGHIAVAIAWLLDQAGREIGRDALPNG